MEQRLRSAVSEEEMRRLAEVARLYYISDFTQEEIASRMRISRSKVSRMLGEARARGLVEIKVRYWLSTVPDLQERLGEELGLKDCLVLASSATSGGVAEEVGALAGQYLQENIVDGSIVGVGWSSAVYSTVGSESLQKKEGITVAQLMGSVGDAITELNGVYITGRLAEALGAHAHYMHAPMIVTDVAVRDGLMCDRYIRETLETARRASVMLVGIGAVNKKVGQYRAGYLDDEDLEYIRGRGAIGEVNGTYFSEQGDVVPLELNDRIIGLGFEELMQIPLRVGVSQGDHKVRTNVGAARTGLINVLVTDEKTARKMLDLLAGGSAPV